MSYHMFFFLSIYLLLQFISLPLCLSVSYSSQSIFLSSLLSSYLSIYLSAYMFMHVCIFYPFISSLAFTFFLYFLLISLVYRNQTSSYLSSSPISVHMFTLMALYPSMALVTLYCFLLVYSTFPSVPSPVPL